MNSQVALSTKVFDLNGSIFLQNVDESSTDMRDYRRRLTRTATLDTGAYIDDRGYFPGDRTVNISVNGDKVMFDALLYILQNYASIWIFLPDGAYSGNMSRLIQNNGRIRLTLLLEADA